MLRQVQSPRNNIRNVLHFNVIKAQSKTKPEKCIINNYNEYLKILIRIYYLKN
jgi:hypothetical protein